MATLKQVALQAGVSPSTASAALRGLDIVTPQTTKRVIKAADKLHYRVNIPARALQTGRTGILSLVIPSVDNGFYALLAQKLSQAATQAGNSLIIQLTDYDMRREFNLSKQASLSLSDGMIICNTQNNAQKIRQAVGREFPLVTVNDLSSVKEGNCDFLYTPSQAGMLAVIHHLVERNRRNIAIVGTTAQMIHDMANNNSVQGLHLQASRGMYASQALTHYGLVHDDSVYIHASWTTEAGIRTGWEYARSVRKNRRKPFNAMVCLNDELALGVMRGLQSGGLRVPEDVAVTGFDGITESSHSTPTLTTVAVDYDGLAQSIMQLISSRINTPGTTTIMPRTVYVGFHLEERESTLIQEHIRARAVSSASHSSASHQRSAARLEAVGK